MSSERLPEQPDARLGELRGRIAELDRAILDAVNGRIELVLQVRLRKRELGVPFVDPAQEARLLAALADANRGPLSEPALRELFGLVLALTKREVARAELQRKA